MWTNTERPRPLSAKEKSIRARYGFMFVVATLTALGLGTLYNKERSVNADLKHSLSKLDSAYAVLDYSAFFYDKDSSIVYYELNEDGDTVVVNIPDEEKIRRLFEDAKNHREISQDLFELTSGNARYEMALEYYSDPLMHQEYRDRTGTDFKSKYTPAQRKEIVEKIKKETGSFNRIIAYRDAFDWYREIDPVAIKEIEVFLFFTE